PSIFPGVGDASKDQARVAWNNSGDGSLLLMFDQNLSPTERFGVPESRDPVRRRFAIDLYHLALRLIGFHEIGHLAQGHIDLVQKNRLALCLFDSAGAYLDEHTLLIRALEQHADLHAFERMVNHLVIDALSQASPEAISAEVCSTMYAIAT